MLLYAAQGNRQGLATLATQVWGALRTLQLSQFMHLPYVCRVYHANSSCYMLC